MVARQRHTPHAQRRGEQVAKVSSGASYLSVVLRTSQCSALLTVMRELAENDEAHPLHLDYVLCWYNALQQAVDVLRL